jgi:hypothetical protein|tara:strand:- start:360 stop:8894 length:8535 start_codon:yes stop_codon:yes gene_type:complete
MTKYKLEDGSVVDVTDYSQESIDFLLAEHPEAMLLEEGESDFQNGAATMDAGVVPIATPSRASVMTGVKPESMELDLDSTSSDLLNVDPIIEVKLPTRESFIPKEAYSTNKRGTEVIDPNAVYEGQKKYNKYYNELSRVNLDLSKVSLDSAIVKYNQAYGGNDGFDFEKSGNGVTVAAPNGETKTFRTSEGGGRGGYRGQQWSSVQEFVERNKDPEAAAKTKRKASNLERTMFDIIEQGSYYDLPGGDAYIKDTNDLLQNHPDLVQEIKNEAINKYNRIYQSDGEDGFFGDTAFEAAGITDYKLDKLVQNAFGKSIAKDAEEADIVIQKILLDEAKKKFGGDRNAMADWATKGGAAEIVDPNKKIIAARWAEAYKLQSDISSQQLAPEDLAIKTKQLEVITAEATALSKEHLNPDNVILFSPVEGLTKTLNAQDAAAEEGIDVTAEVNAERARLFALKSGNFQALKNRYTAHRIDLVDMRANLQTEYDVVMSDGRKYSAPLKDLVDGYFGTGVPAGIKVYGKKQGDDQGGGMQSVMDNRAIEGIAKEYLSLKSRDIAFQDMYLLNIDPKSVERTGFFGALGESFMESLTDGDTVDYYAGANSSDILKEMETIGGETGFKFDQERADNFKETMPEFLGTTAGGLPVLAAEFAVANAVSGGILGVTGLTRAMQGMRFYGGAVNRLKLESINAVVEGFKMASIMPDGGFAMGSTFSLASSLVNTVAGRLGLRFKATGPFHKLNDLVLKPGKGGLVMMPSAEGGAIIEAAIDDYIGGKDFNTYIDENFRDVEWLGEGGLLRRNLGHAVAGSILAYSHLPLKKIFGKNLKGQYALRTKAIEEGSRLDRIRKGTKSKTKIKELDAQIEKNREIYREADNYISEAFALDKALDPQENGKQAINDFTQARKDYKKRTGKDLNLNVRVELEGEGMQGKAAEVEKNGDTWNVVIDAGKYHKGIFGHELAHVFGETFNMNDPEGLKEITKFVGKTVNENLGVDFKGLIEKLYKGKQIEELNPEEYLAGIIEVLGAGGKGLVRNNAYGQIAQNLRSFYERRMKSGFKGDAPKLRIESPQELLSLLQRLAQGAGKKGSVKQYAALQGLYINGKYIFNGKTKSVKGSYSSLNVSGELNEQAKKIKTQIEALESEFYDEGQMDIDVFEQQLDNLNKKLIVANKAPVVEKVRDPKKDIEVFHGGNVKNVKDIEGSVYFSESKEQAREYAEGNQGEVKSFKLNEADIATEAQVFETIREIGIKPKDKAWTVDDSRLYELIDNRFDQSFSKEDMSKLNEALSKKGIRAARFTDTDLRSGGDTNNIVVFDKSAIDQKAKAPKAKPKVVNVEAQELKQELKKEKKQIGDAINEMIPKDMSSSEWTQVGGKIGEAFQKGMLFPLFVKMIKQYGIVAEKVYGKTQKEFYDAAINVQFIKNILNFKPKTKERPGGNDDFGGYIIGSQFGLKNRIKEALTELRKGKELAEAKDASTTKDLAAENDSGPAVSEKRLIEPVNRLITDPEIKDKYIAKVKEVTKDLDPESVTFKTLADAAPELTKEVFGRVMKVKNGKTSVDAAKTKIEQQIFIRKNAESIYALLPLGARRQAEGLSTSTGIKPILLKKFYEVGSRADMMEGTAAGLPTQLKKAFDKTAFLEVFGANKGQKADRNQQTAIDALIVEIGRAMTNRTYRQELENVDYSMQTIQKIADGKSVNMAAMDVVTKLGEAIVKSPRTKESEQTYRQLISQISRNLPKYFGELTNEIRNSADKRNVTVEQIVEERLMQEVNWKIRYDKDGLEYTPLDDIGSGLTKAGKKRSEELVKGLKVILEAFPDMETAPSWLRNSLMSTVGVNKRLRLEGQKISQKSAGVSNRADMIKTFYGEVKYNKSSEEKWGAKGSPYQYSYFQLPGKGKSDPKKIGGAGFNGRLEKKLISLKEKYKNDTSNSKFRQEYIDYVRKELTHPELKGLENGYELTADANLNVIKKAYTSLYDAVKSGKISETTAADVLRIQTNHSDGIFKVLVPYESITMGNIGRYKKGKGKNTHNEHMVELMNYNLDFISLIQKSKSREAAIEGINDLVEGLGQAVIDVPTQRVKDSKVYGGSSKQVYADRVLNTFLRTGSLNNNLIMTGDYKGSTQAEALYKKLGVKGLQSALDKVPEHRRQVSWNEMNDALQKLKEQQTKASLDISAEFNKIIKETTGVSEEISGVRAKQEAGIKGKYKLFVSASADDFVGLMNYNAGKGKQGEAHQKWFKENLYDPYAEAYRKINFDNVQMGAQFKEIKKHIKSNAPSFKLRKQIPNSKFTYEQALRVSIWDSQEMKVPGLNENDLSFLRKTVNENIELSVLKLNLKRIAGGEYSKPGNEWYAGDISTDLRIGLNTTSRAKRLRQWKENVDAMFTPETLNKLEAAHGTPYRKALVGMLDAMYTGRTRRSSANSLEGRTLNYLNNSVGTVMFLNQRSATLQMLSATNYINWSDNNPLKAGAALANVPQFAKDFKTLFQSDWAKSRREGLRINVTESEIADAVTGSNNTPKSIVSLLLKKGFLPTQIADATATALGGASLYRNRIKTYLKQVDAEGNKLYTEKQAEDKAMGDWIEISETNQQSSRPDKVSMQQRSDLGKLVLAFANTPMQYTRESKKAILDLKNGRGDAKTNLSKLAYYTFVQSAIFASMQSAIFKMAWSDDAEDEAFIKNKAPKIINSMADGFLRGMGYGGGIISMLKNTALNIEKQGDYGYRADREGSAWKLLDISPPISSKVGKIRYSLKEIDKAGGFDKAMEAPMGFDNPLLKGGAGMFEATTNIPTARVLAKIQSLTAAADQQREWYEQLALLSGWKTWELEPEIKPVKPVKPKKRRRKRGTGTRKSRN